MWIRQPELRHPPAEQGTRPRRQWCVVGVVCFLQHSSRAIALTWNTWWCHLLPPCTTSTSTTIHKKRHSTSDTADSQQSTPIQPGNASRVFALLWVLASSSWIGFYPHMPVCVFVRLQISLPRIKLAASNFARRFIGVQGRESHIFVNFAPAEAQNRTNRPARPCCNVMLLGFCDSHAYQVRVACGRRIGMCGYTSVP